MFIVIEMLIECDGCNLRNVYTFDTEEKADAFAKYMSNKVKEYDSIVEQCEGAFGHKLEYSYFEIPLRVFHEPDETFYSKIEKDTYRLKRKVHWFKFFSIS